MLPPPALHGNVTVPAAYLLPDTKGSGCGPPHRAVRVGLGERAGDGGEEKQGQEKPERAQAGRAPLSHHEG